MELDKNKIREGIANTDSLEKYIYFESEKNSLQTKNLPLRTYSRGKQEKLIFNTNIKHNMM